MKQKLLCLIGFHKWAQIKGECVGNVFCLVCPTYGYSGDPFTPPFNRRLSQSDWQLYLSQR